MTEMIRRLERDGLVERRPDPADGRASLIFLTDRSRRFKPTAAATLLELDQLVRTRLSARRVSALQSALRELMDLD
jgi:DNA-binding MarR family transcriptional regulator